MLKPGPAVNTTFFYELRANGVNGPVLASGETFADSFSQLVLRYDPVTRTVSGNVNGVAKVDFPELDVPLIRMIFPCPISQTPCAKRKRLTLELTGEQ